MRVSKSKEESPEHLGEAEVPREDAALARIIASAIAQQRPTVQQYNGGSPRWRNIVEALVVLAICALIGAEVSNASWKGGVSEDLKYLTQGMAILAAKNNVFLPSPPSGEKP